ncbi:MAG: porphobilinogen synthase, partial [Gammaproteobacteria bacterium]|nr:porphobilinogen synthase [Gammaproteobacteria bacterium]
MSKPSPSTRVPHAAAGPSYRPRRLRRGQRLRDAMADVQLVPDDLILPLFVRHGERLDRPVSSMPGVSQMSPDVAAARIAALAGAGLRQFLLFGVIDAHSKDESGSP